MKLTIKSQTERLHQVRDFVSNAARKYGFDEEAVNKIALAVDEACTNIIKHSYQYANDQTIEVRINAGKSGFEIIIADKGVSFDPNSVQKPDMNEYLSHYRRGGLGIYLMRSLMDEVEYKAYPDKRNEVRMVKYLASKSQS